jgi:hypothetical protein
MTYSVDIFHPLHAMNQAERIYNFAGYFNFAIAIGIAIGLEMSIIFDPDPESDSDPDDLFNVNAVTLCNERAKPPRMVLIGWIGYC